MNSFVTSLLPSLSKSLSETFNIFRVMHHGTHEKQLSNVFAWLLTADATHNLGDRFQAAFVKRVNERVHGNNQLPLTGYRIVQEVDTRMGELNDPNEGMDIADIILWRNDAALVVENYGTSDGHGHSYQQYLAHGSAGDRRAVVVLLCHRHEAHLQKDGWELATVVTYSEVLSDLKAQVDSDSKWRREHPEQEFFINQMYQHFVKGPEAVNVTDQLSFIKAMCETGESARYSYRPRDRATQEFADLVAEHARKQFEDSRATLARVKDRLRSFSRSVLVDQVNANLGTGHVEKVVTRFSGQWEWCVELQRTDSERTIFLEFGPTAVVENERADAAIDDPDFGQVFATLRNPETGGISRIAHTGVSLAEVISGINREDTRLRDAVLSITQNDS
ncbi:PD-(D/E)XK nuclease family protein [Brevibacterium sp. VCM10]|uniref:PD-(D/E)XK nuclease family protein n=1 Tax=Brevibacterium sp. VCM10 TaxID=1381751 RepID=UPI00047144B5|nr:PD-(D/E)XK nuclease family protein [Brevibacterium sp. VCM10]